MSHRTQITLTDAQYARLKEESQRTGLGLAELVRRAVAASYGDVGTRDALDLLNDSFGTWKDREFDGESYVCALRRGLSRRLPQ